MDCGYFPLGYNKKEEPLDFQGSLSPDNYRGRHIYALYSHIYNQLSVTFLNFKRPTLTDLSDIKIKLNSEKRQHLLLTGKNGSGKTQLLLKRCLVKRK